MRRRIAILAVAVALVATACTPKENPNVTPSSRSKQDTLNQVRALQQQVREYGTDFMAALGGASPAPVSVRIGPAPCPGQTNDLAEDGAYYVAGGWQIPLAAEEQVETIRALRDSWQTKGYKIVLYEEIDNGTRARLEGEDTKNGFTFSVISTNPPTAVGIRVLSTCVTPPDREFPGDGVTVYE